MADTDKKHQTDDIEELEGGKPLLDENDENFNDSVDIDAIQSQLMEYININEFEGAASDNQGETATINTIQQNEQHIEEVPNENQISSEDSMEINEIISMNDDITPEMIEQAENNLKSFQEGANSVETHDEDNQSNSSIVLDYLSTKNRPKSVEGYKKYIVYIDPDNEDYMNSLTLQERKDIINSILHGENLKEKRLKEAQKKKEFMIQVIIVAFCIIIGFPLLYKLTNFCLTATINSYKEAQTNFEKLYKETGKIKVKKDFGMR